MNENDFNIIEDFEEISNLNRKNESFVFSLISFLLNSEECVFEENDKDFSFKNNVKEEFGFESSDSENN